MNSIMPKHRKILPHSTNIYEVLLLHLTAFSFMFCEATHLTNFTNVYSSTYRRNKALAVSVVTYRRKLFLCHQWQDSKETKQHWVRRLTQLHTDLHNCFMEVQHVMTETKRSIIQLYAEDVNTNATLVPELYTMQTGWMYSGTRNFWWLLEAGQSAFVSSCTVLSLVI